MDAITPTNVTEPCPTGLTTPESADANRPELAELERMLGVVVAYGGEHIDEFGSYGLVWQADEPYVMVSFTQDVERHRDALGKLVVRPSDLIVCQVAVSGTVGNALAAKLSEQLAGRFAWLGAGIGGVEIVLLPGEEALARELEAQYADAVIVSMCTDDCSATAA